MQQARRQEFAEEGVTVNVPAQSKRIRAVKLPLLPLSEMPAVPGGFQPRRPVMNIALVDEDDPETFLTRFDEPFELRVRYTKADHDRAEAAGRPLALAFWNGSEWVRFTAAKHQFRLEPDENPARGGFGVAQIAHWGDPVVSWGD